MSGSLKLGLYILATVVAVYVGYKILAPLLGILLVAGVGLVIFGLVTHKALGGGRRTLP